MVAWTIETAKARLSHVVRQAKEEGPQTISVRGVDAVIVLSAEDYGRLIHRGGGESWVDRFRAAFTGEIDLSRDQDGSRDLDL